MMITMNNSTYLIQLNEQHKILKNSSTTTSDDLKQNTMKGTDLTDATLINTNHNCNYFNQTSSFNSPILKSNGTHYTLDSFESRGVNALHRRAEQLQRWKEAEDEYEIKRQHKQLDNNHANLINKANLIFKKRNDDQRKIKFSNSTLFLAACASADYDEINRLLNNNLVDINVGNIDGLTALHHACIDDNPELVEFLLKKGADVNCVDNEGWSPLHATASCDHLEIAKLLLLYGADCKLVNVDHELALDLAEDEKMHKLLQDALYEQEKISDLDKLRRQEEDKMREDVLEMIRTGIFDNKVHKRTGATIIHVAACKGYLEILQLLFGNKNLKKQIDINVRDNEGWTPLTAATYWNKPLVVELLLQNGADVNVVTNNNQTLEQLTDYDLILNLIATRREQLKKQETQRQEENSNLNKSTSNAESETQRRAHAKRIRESRRSTQGISAEDVNKAKDQLLLNSTIINLSGNSSSIACSPNTTINTSINNDNQSDVQNNQFEKLESNKVEITKLETINEINTNEEPISIQSVPIVSTLQKTSRDDSCEIVEVKSVLDNVDGQRKYQREFTRPYRPKITVDENDEDNVDQELKATINLNKDNKNDKDELKNDVVLNLRRDSLNILHQRKDTKKSAALNHSNTNSVRVERLDDYQSPKISTITSNDLNSLEDPTLNYTVRRDMSQDSLDEQTNGNDYIGINSTLNYTINNGLLNDSTTNKFPSNHLNMHSIIERQIDKHLIDTDKQKINRNLEQINLDKNIDREPIIKPPQHQLNENLNSYKPYQLNQPKFTEHKNLINSNYLPATKSANHLTNQITNHLTSNAQFEVPVLIETPCTPEPVDECSTESNSESSAAQPNRLPQNTNNYNDSENNLTRRKRTTKRIDNNQEELDTLFNETMNTINPKYTRNIEQSLTNDKNNYLYNKNLVNSQTKSNGNALKLYKKVDEDLKLPNNSVTRSRPSSTSSTNSYKTADNKPDASSITDRFVNNNDNLVDKSTKSESNGKISSFDQTKELDYKKMYEDLLVEFENFKIESNKKEQDFLREKRQMQRKISELEEELVQMESVKEDNTRLKNENGALVRVISKLSK